MPDTSSPCRMFAPMTCNGVNVTALMETVAAVKATPAIAKFNFRATNKWMDGEKNRTTMKTFTGALQEHRTQSPPFVYDNGEPAILLGEDKAPNPVEWLLHALIGCMTTSTAYHAASCGVEIRSIESSIEGDLDLRGFLGISSKIRKGYSEIRVTMRVGTNATANRIETFVRMSPLLDVVSRSVPVQIEVRTT